MAKKKVIERLDDLDKRVNIWDKNNITNESYKIHTTLLAQLEGHYYETVTLAKNIMKQVSELQGRLDQHKVIINKLRKRVLNDKS